MNSKWLRFGLALAVLTAGGAWGLTSIVKPAVPVDPQGKLRVVAAENFWGDIAAQIGGNRVQVTSIISDPGTDPHLYESNAGNAAAVAAADLVVYNGLGYDDFMTKLLSAAPMGQRHVLSAAAASDTADGSNPHIWYDLMKTKKVAEAITTALADKDSGHAAEYKDNLRKFEIALKPVAAAQAKIGSFYGGVPVAYTERVPEYLIRDMGLTTVSPEGFARAIEDGSEPSPADMAAMRKLIVTKAVRVLFYNSQASSPATQQIKTLAEQSGVPVMAVSETMPSDQPNYQTWQLSQINKLEVALSVY